MTSLLKTSSTTIKESERVRPFRSFSLGKRRKDSSLNLVEQYEITAQGGARDGVLLSRGEHFQRSWTIMNTAPIASKPKSRVSKLVQSSGHPMVESLLFLWPPPGKSVVVTLELQAPEEPGWYESYWKIEGQSREKDFGVKFEVLDLDYSLSSAPKENSNSEQRSRDASSPKKLRRRKKRRHGMNLKRAGTLTDFEHSTPDDDKAARFKRSLDSFLHSLDNETDPSVGHSETDTDISIRVRGQSKSPSADSFGFWEDEEWPQIPEIPTTIPRSDSAFLRDEPTGSVDLMQEDLTLTESEAMTPLIAPLAVPIPEDPLPLDISEEDTQPSAEAKKDESTECGEIQDALASPRTSRSHLPPPRRRSKETSPKAVLQPEGVSVEPEPIVTREVAFAQVNDSRSLHKPRTSVVDRWQESVINDETYKQCQLDKRKKTLSIQRALSLRHSVTKNRIISLSSQASDLTSEEEATEETQEISSSVVSNVGGLHREVGPIQQPSVSLITDVLCKMELTLQLSQELQEALQVMSSEFSMDNPIMTLVNSCREQLENFIPDFAQTTEEMETKQVTVPNVYFVGELPADLWVKIFSYLSIPDLCRVAQTCSFWKYLSEHDSLWVDCYSRLQVPPVLPTCEFVARPTKAKSLYKMELGLGPWFETNMSLGTAEPLCVEKSSSWPVYDLAVGSDTLVTVSDCVRVFDLKRGKLRAKMVGHEKVTQCVHLAKEARACVTGSVDKTVKIWSLSDLECINTLKGHLGAVNDVKQMGDLIVSTSMHDKTVRFWDPFSAKCLHKVESIEGVTRLALNPNSPQHIYLGTVDGNLVTWDVDVQCAVETRKVATGMVEDLWVSGDIIIASDYTRVNIQSVHDPSLECLSPMMKRNVGQVRFDGCRLGAQVGTRLNIFDIRYLFERCGDLAVDNLWKGAFQFYGDDAIIGTGAGKIYRWSPC